MQSKAAQLDEQDPLQHFRSEFHFPIGSDGQPLTYLCGHSLGLQPRSVATFIQEELLDWQRLGVEGHFTGRRPWMPYHELAASGLAQLLGAETNEVVAMNSLSVNLHLMLVSFYRPTSVRHKILIEKQAFPSDRYAVQSQIRFHGFDPQGSLIEVGPRPDERVLRTQDLLDLIEREGHTIATILLPGVQYLSGQALDLKAITQAAHRQGCVVGFDLAHAIGNLVLNLHDAGPDFAVWCSYKYLNAGPGAVGGAFVHGRHAHNTELPRFAGWWGHDKSSRFAMPDTFLPTPGAEGWQISNPPILALAPLVASLDIFSRAGIQRLRAKSISMMRFLENEMAPLKSKATIVTPKEIEARGNQMSLILNEDPARAMQIHRQLHERGIVCDWREPNIVRIALAPLYNTFRDAAYFAHTLATIMSN